MNLFENFGEKIFNNTNDQKTPTNKHTRRYKHMRHVKCQNHVPKRRLNMCAYVYTWLCKVVLSRCIQNVVNEFHGDVDSCKFLYEMKFNSFLEKFRFFHDSKWKWTEPLSSHMHWSSCWLYFVIQLINLGSREKKSEFYLFIHFDYEWINGQNDIWLFGCSRNEPDFECDAFVLNAMVGTLKFYAVNLFHVINAKNMNEMK